jgi:hypothetical protein
MLNTVHRAVSAVLHVMLVAFVTLSARAQHGVLRSKHWFAPVAAGVRSKHWFAPVAAGVAATALLGLNGWLVQPDRWIW